MIYLIIYFITSLIAALILVYEAVIFSKLNYELPFVIFGSFVLISNCLISIKPRIVIPFIMKVIIRFGVLPFCLIGLQAIWAIIFGAAYFGEESPEIYDVILIMTLIFSLMTLFTLIPDYLLSRNKTKHNRV